VLDDRKFGFGNLRSNKKYISYIAAAVGVRVQRFAFTESS
jgi:hypothetical protein